MRQNANSRRSRGRGGRKSGNTRNQVFDSNGPGARVRGNASQIYEKYQQLARDAASSGDRVAAENLLQHAEHYFRLMMLHSPRPESNRDNGQDGDSDDGDNDRDDDGQDNQPEVSFDEDRRPNGGSNGGNVRGDEGDNGSAPPRRRRRRSGGGESAEGVSADQASADSGDGESVTA